MTYKTLFKYHYFLRIFSDEQYHLHVIEEETEAQKGYVICSGSHKQELENKPYLLTSYAGLFPLFTSFPRRVITKGEPPNKKNTLNWLLFQSRESPINKDCKDSPYY